MDFEQSMARLNQISELMGKNDLKLEESMKLYTEAVELTKQCKEYIKNAQLQIETLEAAE
ncbi:MAG: exodeoxyribonuclease VII small subunit [Oscillospiraceae bacterium]|nr:exodeoxyribonuclease VII small subunit [Oscillospiraceae bacterium]